MRIGLFYGSSTGNTENAAELIAARLGGFAQVDLYNIASADLGKMAEYDLIIAGCSTWGEGDLQDDWESGMGELKKLDLSGKKIALFGLGDQEGYEENFLDAMGILHNRFIAQGATPIGYTSTDGYYFEASKAAINAGTFCGLGLDEDNQEHLSDERITAWVETLKSSLA